MLHKRLFFRIFAIMINSSSTLLHDRLLGPMSRFMGQEKSGGIVLAFSVLIALVIANSGLYHAYEAFFHSYLGFVYNDTPFFHFSIAHWINDGLMSMFFFVVGLELKREFIGGELRDIRKVVLPAGAALLGMVVPALIYLSFNRAGNTADGWGIPMATDIAFALAVLFVLGNKVPASAKVFLTTLAIVDDLGAVLVIAFFYTSTISLTNIAVGLAFLLVMYAANRLGVKNVLFYGLVGIVGVWTSFLMSGVHATISAVLAAFMIPADSTIPEAAFIARIKKRVRAFESVDANDVSVLEEEQLEILTDVQRDTTSAIPPLQRLEHGLHPWVSFLILPIFALANAGLRFVGMDLESVFLSSVTWGVFFGLLIGKPLGVFLSTWLLCRLGLGSLSNDMSWRHIIGLGFLASIGFTMSIFVTTLAFDDTLHISQAKVGILLASLWGAVIGYLLLSGTSSRNKNV